MENKKIIQEDFKSLISLHVPNQVRLFDWLLARKDYDKSFWTDLNNAGEHFLLELIPNTDISGFFDKWLEETSNIDLINTPTNDGKVLFHYLWEKLTNKPKSNSTYFNRYSLGDEKEWNFLIKVMDKTNQKFYTFLDKEHNDKGFGLINKLILIEQSYPDESKFTKRIIDKIKLAFPQSKPTNTGNPFSNVKRPDNVDSLLLAGHSLNQEINCPHNKVPAWLWILAKENNHNGFFETRFYQYADKGLLDKEKLDNFIKTKKEWSSLIPADRRSKIGYVKSILAKEGTDHLGRVSLDYLFKHREDLFDLLLINLSAIDKNKLNELFNKTDIFGYTVLDRAFFSIDSINFKKLIDWLEFCKIESKFTFNKKGLAFNLHDNTIPSIGKYEFSVYKKSENLTPEMFFGDKKMQDFWSAKWEDILLKIFDKDQPIDSQISPYIKQLFTYMVNYESWHKNMDETLNSQLKMASWIMFLPFRAPNLHKTLNFSEHYMSAGISLVEVDYSPPTIWTKSMQKIMENGFHLPRPHSRMDYLKTNKLLKELTSNPLEHWQTSCKLSIIQDSTKDIAESKSDTIKKLKI